MSTLKYSWSNGDYETFDKYTIDTSGVITNKESGQRVSYFINKTKKNNGTFREDYYCSVFPNEGTKRMNVRIARAVLSTFVGEAPTKKHTADHIDRNSLNNSLQNLRWATKKEQVDNRDMPETQDDAFIIVKNGLEKTAKEWAEELKLNYKTIIKYARNKKNCFSYKEYPDLPGEIWKKVECSDNKRGHWEVSNKKRAKHVKNTGNYKIFEEFGHIGEYPSIGINSKLKLLHIVIFRTFNPDIDIGDNVVRHIDDDKMNFVPENLAIGTKSQNGSDAHENGRYDGTKSARKPVVSYINGVFEKEHASLSEAARYLQDNGYPKASASGILQGMRIGGIRYGRTWKHIDTIDI